MKNNPLDDIIKCNVEISSPASEDVSFDTILMVVAAPASGTASINKATPITKADELLDVGFAASDAAYVAASVAFSQSPAPSEIYVIVRNSQEEIADCLKRAAAECDFYGIYLTSIIDNDDIQAAVAWAEANEKMYVFEYTSLTDCPVSVFTYYRTIGLYAGQADGFDADAQPEQNKYAGLALMAKCFGYDPGSETWAYKELAGITASALSTTEKKDLEEKHINTFLRYAGSNVTIGGYTLAGEWIDVIRFRDWLKATMQNRVFNTLKVNRKVPFTDSGIGLIEAAMESTLADGQAIGGICQTEYDADGNAIPGYTITVPVASDLTEAQRKSRKLTGCKYTARLAGAIHAVEIEGFLSF